MTRPARVVAAALGAGALAVGIAIAVSKMSEPEVPPEPVDVLRWVADFYDRARELEIPFKSGTEIQGHLRVRRPGQFHIQYEEPEVASICNDGRRTVADATERGYHAYGPPAAGLPGLDLLVGTAEDAVYDLDAASGPATVCLETDPPEPTYTLLRVCVSSAEGHRGEILRLSWRGPEDVEITYRFGPARSPAEASNPAAFCPEPSAESRLLTVRSEQ